MRVEAIGNATIYLGDCRDVLPLLPSLGSLVTDPPYGNATVLGMGGGYKGDGGMWKGVAIPGDQNTTLRDAVLELAAIPFAAFGSPRASTPPGTRATLVWDKGEHTGAGDLSLPWKPSFELVFIGGKGWAWKQRTGGVIRVNAVAGCVADRNDGRRYHPFEKPLAIMRHLCERAPEGPICDPFMGSGTTGVACLKLGRPFIGIEGEQQYFDIACRRLEGEARQPELFKLDYDEIWSHPYIAESGSTEAKGVDR